MRLNTVPTVHTCSAIEKSMEGKTKERIYFHSRPVHTASCIFYELCDEDKADLSCRIQYVREVLHVLRTGAQNEYIQRQ